ncbi:MAG TPA: FRG domain-containing protein [Actinokineospora sp.]|jgi:hypothetical protein|nr:FRG domain-containing protein [Actinokineospora sp.]
MSGTGGNVQVATLSGDAKILSDLGIEVFSLDSPPKSDGPDRYGANAKWIQDGWGFTVSSQDELMRCIGRIGTLQVGRRYVWRGVASYKWRVQSSLLRRMVIKEGLTSITESDVRARERALLREARRWGINRELGGAATDQQLLAVLQHHGGPTRLLDVTSNPMTALWFACQKPDQSTSNRAGALMAFDVTNLPVLVTASHELGQTFGAVADPLGWHLEDALKQSVTSGQPFLVQPSYPDPRMVAQEGLFLTGAVPDKVRVLAVDGLPLGLGAAAPGEDALSTLFDPLPRGKGRPSRLPFVVLIVPAAIKQRMLRHLESTYNRHYRYLFPDVAGFVAALKAGQLDLSHESC